MAKRFSEYQSDNNYKYINPNGVNTQDLNSLVDMYSHKSSEELMKEFVKLSNQKKANGTLNESYIGNLRNAIFPYLTNEQKQLFEDLINGVK